MARQDKARKEPVEVVRAWDQDVSGGLPSEVFRAHPAGRRWNISAQVVPFFKASVSLLMHPNVIHM